MEGLVSHEVPKQFPHSSHQIPVVPIKILFFSSSFLKNSHKITYQNPFVLIKFPKNSHQISLVPIKILFFLSCSHRIPFVPIEFLLFQSSSHQLCFVPNPTLHNKPTQSSKLCARLKHKNKRMMSCTRRKSQFCNLSNATKK